MRQVVVCVSMVLGGVIACTASEPVSSSAATPESGVGSGAHGDGSAHADGSATATATADTGGAEPAQPTAEAASTQTAAERLIGTAWVNESESLPIRYIVFGEQLALTGLADGSQRAYPVDYSEILPSCRGVSPCIVLGVPDASPSTLHFRSIDESHVNPVQCVDWSAEGSEGPRPTAEALRTQSGLEIAHSDAGVLCVYDPDDVYTLSAAIEGSAR